MNSKPGKNMKKIYFSIIAAAVLSAGCNSEIIEQQGSGSLAIDLSCKSDYTVVATKATDEEIINDLAIDIVRPYDGWSVNYTPFSSIRGKVVELGSGDYIITASSQSKEHAAYDQPIYEGSEDFTIMTGQVTTIDLLCKISNVKVSINLSDNFASELSDYTVTVSNGKGTLSWVKTSEKDDFKPIVVEGKTVFTSAQAGYFTVAPLSVTVNGHRAIDDTDASTVLYIENVNAADHHILNLDAKVTGQIGDVDESGNVIQQGITITISHDVNPIDQNVVIPGFDEIPVEGDKPSEGGDEGDDEGGNQGGDPVVPETPTDMPKLIWPANPDFADVELPMTTSAVVDVELTIEVPKGIAEFLIYVDSGVLSPTIAALTAAGTVDENGIALMDMINDDTLYANLGEGLPMKDKVLNQTSVEFSLSSLVPLINMYVQDISSGDKHLFTLHVVDNEGNVLEQTVTFVSVPAE